MCPLIFDFLFNVLVAFVSLIDHEGGSYIHVPYITERRPYMSTHPVFLRVTPVMNLPKCKVTEVFIKLMYFLLILGWSQLLVVIQEM
jgi:hypothetical protein